MPSGTVQGFSKTRTGKPTVTVDGQVYYTGKTDLAGLSVGSKIAFESNSSQFRGETYWYLNAWKLLEAAKTIPLPTPRGEEIPAPTVPRAVSEGITEPERIFAYGVVTESIKAGLIKEPEQIEKWVCAAKNALRSQGE